MLETTTEGQAAMADLVKAQRQHHLSGDELAAAGTAGVDHGTGCKCTGCKAKVLRKPGAPYGRPDDGGTVTKATGMTPGPISPEQYQRQYIADGNAAASREAGPSRQFAAPPSLRVTGEGPGADAFLAHGGRQLQRPAPREGQ